MTSAHLLAELSTLHELTCALVEGVDDSVMRHPYAPDFAPLGWYLGRCAYAESEWLRGQVMGNCQFSPTVTELFAPGATPMAHCGLALPARDELLHWVRSLQETALTLFANPRQLPDHPLLADDFLLHHVVVQYALAYEEMLQVLAQRHLVASDADFTVSHPLRPQLPILRYQEVSRGQVWQESGRKSPFGTSQTPDSCESPQNYCEGCKTSVAKC